MNVKLIAPELVLFFTAIATLLADIRYAQKQSRAKMVTAAALVGMLIALACAVLTLQFPATEAFSRTMMIDPVSQFFKILFIVAGMTTVTLGWMSAEVRRNEKAEMHALLILGTLGMCVMSSAVHFLLLFMSYEVVGIACYILAAFKRRSGLSSEAGVKLYVHGALTSILFVFGIVMLYGIGKSFNILDIRAQLAAGPVAIGYLWVAFGLIFVALAARMAVFPFHFLAPDIIEGAPSPASAFFAVSTNLAAAAFALRLCVHLFSAKEAEQWIHLAGFQWPDLITGVAAVTMTVGNLTALFQTNLKRLLGYSGIAQMGYLLMGLVVSNHLGIASLLFSLVAFGIVTLGAFLVIQIVSDEAKSENISILRGLVWKNPYEAVVLCLFLLSLAGLPPMVGFVGRFYVLGVVVREKLYWIAIVGAVNTVIGLAYYLSMIREIFAPRSQIENFAKFTKMTVAPIAHVAMALLVIPTVVLGIYWDPLMNYITQSLGNVMW